jgi:hypothetical protein
MTVLAIPIIIFAPFIITLFDPSAHPILLDAGVSYLRISTVALPLASIAIVANGNLRGAGDSVPGLISTIFTRGIATVSSAYVLALVLGWGSDGVWYGIAIGVVLDSVYMGWRWRGSAWLKVALEKAAIYRQHLSKLPETVIERYLREIRTPLMSQTGAFEDVTPDGVIYHLEKRELEIQFSTQSYKVLEPV